MALAAAAQSPAVPVDVRRLSDDRSVPLEWESRPLTDNADARVFDITYRSPRAGRVTGYLVEPQTGGQHAAVLFGHWGYGNRAEFLPEAVRLARAGVVSLMIDYPWVRPAPWRRNEGTLDTPEIDAELYELAVADLHRGLSYLVSRPDVDERRVAYVGHSYGAQFGAILTAFDKRLCATVLIGGLGAQADIYLLSQNPTFVAMRNGLKEGVLDHYLAGTREYDAIRWIGLAAPTPLLFQFGRLERHFDEASMERYAAAASEPKEVHWYWTGHELNDDQAFRDRVHWLAARIGIRAGDVLDAPLARPK